MKGSSKQFPLRFLVAVAIISGCLAACSEKKLSDVEYVAKAKDYLDTKKNKEAAIELKNALSLNPKNAEARWVLGRLYNELGNGAAAEKELRKAIELGVPEPQVLSALAKALLLEGKTTDLLKEIQVTDSLADKEKALVYAYRGRAQLKAGELAAAEQSVQESLKIAADNDEALLTNAYLDIAKREFEPAVQVLDRATKSNPVNIEAWILKGDLHTELGQKVQAFDAYDHVLKISPNNLVVQLSIASAHLAFDELELADKSIAKARSIDNKNPTAKFLQSVIRFRQGNYKAALDGVSEVLKVMPDHSPSILLYGASQLSLGSLEAANEYLSRFVAKFPGSVYARRLLAATALKMGDPKRALSTLDPIQRFVDKDVYLLGLTGDAYLKLAKPDKAIEYFEKAATIEPRRAEWGTQLGLSRLAAGDTAGGIRDLEAASEHDAGQYRADTLLFVTYMRQKDYEKASEVAVGLEKKLGTSPIPYSLQGSVFEAKKDFIGARQSYEKALDKDPKFFSAAKSLARLDLKDNKKADAKTRFKKMLDKDASNVSAMLALAELEAMGGSGEEYVGWLEKAVKAQPADLRAYEQLVRFYLEKRKTKEAIDIARQAVDKTPNSVASHLVLARAQLANGEQENAILSYKRMISLGGDSAAAQFELANAQMSVGDVTNAKDALGKALALNPKFIEAEAAMVSLLFKDGKKDDALRLATKMQTKYTESPMGFVLAGDILFARGNYEQAERNYRQAYERKKEGAVAVSWSKALAAMKKPADAPLKDWLAQNPGDETGRLYLAMAYRNGGKPDLALAEFKAIIDKHPKNAIALNELALTYFESKRIPEAVDAAKKAYDLSPVPAIADTYGWILQAVGDTEKAMPILAKAVAGGTQNPEIRYHYAYVLHKAGKRTEAKSELQKILKPGVIFPLRADAEKLLGQL